MEKRLTSTKQTKKLAQQIAKKLKSGDILALYGDLGSGKTTFTRYLVGALGFSVVVQSPTFVIARRYTGNEDATKKLKNNKSRIKHINTVNHIDLYRLSTKGDIINLCLEEFFTEPNTITVIEWPKICEFLLPKNTIIITFEYINDKERKVNVQNLY